MEWLTSRTRILKRTITNQLNMYYETIEKSEFFNYDSYKDSTTKPNYVIEDGLFKTPIEITYELIHPYGGFSKHSMFNRQDIYTKNLNWKFEQEKSTIQELIEQFLWDEQALLNMLYDEKYPKDGKLYSADTFGPFKIIEKQKIRFTCVDVESSDKDHQFYNDAKIVSTRVAIEGQQIIDFIKSNPRYVEARERAKRIEEENQKIAEEKYNSDKRIQKENSYQMWKILDEKMKNGEFAEFM